MNSLTYVSETAPGGIFHNWLTDVKAGRRSGLVSERTAVEAGIRSGCAVVSDQAHSVRLPQHAADVRRVFGFALDDVPMRDAVQVVDHWERHPIWVRTYGPRPKKDGAVFIRFDGAGQRGGVYTQSDDGCAPLDHGAFTGRTSLPDGGESSEHYFAEISVQ